MKRPPGQPDGTYSARQLEEIGCGVVTTIRRRYAKIPVNQLIEIVVSGNNTNCYPRHLLTEQEQHRVKLHELATQKEAESAFQKQHDNHLPVIATATLPAIIPKNLTVPDTLDLNGKQERILTARFHLLSMIERQCPNGKGVSAAIQDIADKINTRSDEHLVNIAAIANDRKGENRGLSVPTLYRWWTDYQKTGKKQNALAPKKGDRMPRKDLVEWLREYTPHTAAVAVLPTSIPAWVPYFLDEYRRPQKPALQQSHKRICRTMPPEIERPSYDQIRRVMKKVPVIYAEKGRMTNAEYSSICGYVERGTDALMPMGICQIDGHSFKAYVAHPVTGAHFHPEICGVIDLATRALVGWSAGLAESSITVASAFKHCCLVNEKKPWGGIPAILEADRGSGNLAKVNSDDFTGLFIRLGCRFMPPARGGNPQGHGAVERSNQSIWIRAAKQLDTYTGKDMDRGARRQIYDRLERDLRKSKSEGKLGIGDKTSKLLLSWSQFLDFLDDAAFDYNNSPHSRLPKIFAPLPGDPTGKQVKRHMTPLECWADFISAGFQPKTISFDDEAILAKLCHPQKTVTVKREKFTLHGNSYHSVDLDEYHNREVIAAYDIHNPHSVIVLDLDENLICEATWNGNKTHARPVSMVEKATMQRHSRRVKLKEKQIDLMNAEVDRKTIEIRPERIELSPELLETEARWEKKRLLKAEAPKLFSNMYEFYEDVRKRHPRGEASAYEIQWAHDYEKTLFADNVKYSANKAFHVGLYREDPYCHGRFKPENRVEIPEPAQQLIKKAV